MISASLAVEGPPRGLGLPVPGHHLHHTSHHPPPFVTYHHPAPPPSHHPHSPDAWGVRIMVTQPSASTSSVSMASSQPKQAEFLRPLPKPLTTRYNGVPSSNSMNGLRASRPSKYSPPATVTSSGAVNLAQHKEESISSTLTAPPPPSQEELYQQHSNAAAAAAYARLYVPSSFSYANLAGPYGPALYPPPYTPLLSRNALESTFLTPQAAAPQVYSPPGSASASGLHAPSSPSGVKPAPPPHPPAPQQQQQPTSILKERRGAVTSDASFKVPSGKEGSLKHRILTRPASVSETISAKKVTIANATVTSRTLANNNNTIISGGFGKGSLIQLANGELRRVEDMRTEDFVLSAEHTPELRLADSTVVRIEENPILGTTRITLSYNQNRAQVEFESTLEHPFFVYGQGWASCAPERTLQCFGLKCARLQVGDICVSLMPRESNAAQSSPRQSVPSTSGVVMNSKSATVTTTATTTAMTPRQISPKSNNVGASTSGYHVDKSLLPPPTAITQQPPRTHSAEEIAAMEASNARKRRWSAPDHYDEDETPKHLHPARRL